MREIDNRSSCGITVTLFWDPDADTMSVLVEDGKESPFVINDIPKSEAMDAYYHPFTYRSSVKSEPVCA